ncbi:MAG: hypothetical protein ACREEM_02275 [Blastocatellia bacterium]
MQNEILAKNSSAKLKVYAIWFNMYSGDERSKWPASLLTDPRVVHFWDEQKVAGTWFGKHPDYLNGDKVLWDAFLIYQAESNWTDKPSHFAGMGRTIVAKREDLRKNLAPLLKE